MTPREFDLHGKVALVTGAGRGIGGGVARVLAEAGAEVAINALTLRHVEPLAASIAGESGRRVRTYAGDMTRAEAVEDTVRAVLSDFGRIDVLVNAVGDAIAKPLVALPGAPEAAGVDDENLRLTLDLNLTAAVLMARAVGPHLLARGSGKVVSVASFAALRGGAGMTLYAAGKAGLSGFTRALALEWAPYGVQVNAIAPGLFPDPVTAGEEGARRTEEQAARVVPLRRAGRLREVGLLALYLASPASDYMTGQTLYLDGGWTL